MKLRAKKEIVSELDHILSEQTNFETAEAYKTIRTSIMFSLPKLQGGKVIGVTSAIPGEGKSTTVINMGITFAQMGAKVIIIDCDMRKPKMHRYLQIELGEGMSNVICGFSELKNVIRKNVRPGLDCITAGEIPPNAAEVLSSEAFTSIIEELKVTYDYILVDTPPVTVVTDASVISKRCAAMVLVVKNDYTTYDMVDEMLKRLHKVQAKIIGFIMTNSNSKHNRYGSYVKRYKYKYGYKYGYK
ncbi:MAG: CpsD/CapB family tyrosine-protein kinase [Clostridia bacterium]|nr:CpsD/CapB family tyrosine-protein kinase [Clostridia bacterium]